MSRVTIQNTSYPLENPITACRCTSFWCRFKGLMLVPELDEFSGLLFVDNTDSKVNSSIHMLFMRMDLAVFWINSSMQIVDKGIMRPWKDFHFPTAPARFVLEAHPNRIKDYNIGDVLTFEIN